ncbi:MAG: hypothetical protein ACRDX8_05510 [Acidimicrobiales bacterium]
MTPPAGPPPAGPPGSVRGLLGVVMAVARRPGLWGTGVAVVVCHAVPGWWRHRPFLPLPAPRWIEFRLECATGANSGPLTPEDVISWLEWCQQTRDRSR